MLPTFSPLQTYKLCFPNPAQTSENTRPDHTLQLVYDFFQTWYEAVVQSFFSLSVGFGALITYSSYNQGILSAGLPNFIIQQIYFHSHPSLHTTSLTQG